MAVIRGPKIDEHADIERIQFDLIMGKSVRDVARKYGVNKSSVHRLKQKIPPHVRAANLGELLAPGMDLDQLRHEESRGLIAILASQRARLHLLQDRALEADDHELAIKASNAINKNAETLGRYLGEFVSITKSTSVSVILSPEYAKLRTVITEVLRKHPSALADFTERMKQLEAEQLGTVPQPVMIEAHANG